MKIQLIVLLVMQALCLLGGASEWDAWVERFLGEIEAMPDSPSPKEVALLATLGYPSPGVLKPETQIVRETAKERLRQIPDFPEKIAQYIDDEKAKQRSGASDSVHSSTRRFSAFETMSRIPHPGVVKVLGEYLFDWEGRNSHLPPNQRPFPAMKPNGHHAMEALGQLIEKPPVQKRSEIYWKSYSYDDDIMWQLWYEQVRAGTRTFRFKGDPQEYSLAGPVDQAKEPVTSRPAKPLTDTGAAVEEATGSGFSWPILVAALAVCGAGAWLVLKSPRSRPG